MPIGRRRERSLAEMSVDETTEDVVALLAAPADQIVGVDEDPPVVARDATARSAVTAIRDLARIVVVAEVRFAQLGHRQEGLVRVSPCRKSTAASQPSTPRAREKSARE